MDSNTISYFKLQTWNLFFQSDWNICKLTIQIYDVLTLYHTSLYTELNILWSPSNIQTIYTEHIIYIVPSETAYNICKLTIQLLWCSKSRPYKHLSLTSYTLKSIKSKKYTLKTNAAYSSFRLWHFHASVKRIYFPLNPLSTRDHCHNNTQISNFQDVHPRTSTQLLFPRRGV